MYVNLLPPPITRRMQLRNRVRRWGVIWGILALGSVIVVGQQYHAVYRERAKLAALIERGEPLTAIQKETAEFARQLKDLRRDSETLQQIQSSDRTLALLGVLSRAVRAADELLQLQKLSVSARASPATSITPITPVTSITPAAAATPATQPPQVVYTVSLVGVAAGDVALARFIDALRSSAVFDHVELRSSSQSTSAVADGRQFQLECRFAE